MFPRALGPTIRCLAFDGPGQGAVLRDQHLTFRADWESVVSAAADYALKRPEADGERLALMGTSFAGFLAARAARWPLMLRTG